MKGTRVLLTGSSGLVGSHLATALKQHEAEIFSSATGHRAELSKDGAFSELIAATHPDIVIHAGAMTSIAECLAAPEQAQRINVDASREGAQAAQSVGARFVFFSTDQVWDGEEAPYRGSSPATPLHDYGRGKAAAESAIAKEQPDALILRLALVFGKSPTGLRSASEMIINAARQGQTLRLFEDEWRQPIAAGDVARLTLGLISNQARGTYALGGAEALTRLSFGQRVAETLGLKANIEAIRQADIQGAGSRPRDLRIDMAQTIAASEQEPLSCEEALRVAHAE